MQRIVPFLAGLRIYVGKQSNQSSCPHGVKQTRGSFVQDEQEGLSDKEVSKQRPSGSQGDGHADRCRTSLPGSGTSNGTVPRQERVCLRGQSCWSKMGERASSQGETRREGAVSRRGPWRLGKGVCILPWGRWEATGGFTAEDRIDWTFFLGSHQLLFRIDCSGQGGS